MFNWFKKTEKTEVAQGILSKEVDGPNGPYWDDNLIVVDYRVRSDVDIKLCDQDLKANPPETLTDKHAGPFLIQDIQYDDVSKLRYVYGIPFVFNRCIDSNDRHVTGSWDVCVHCYYFKDASAAYAAAKERVLEDYPNWSIVSSDTILDTEHNYSQCHVAKFKLIEMSPEESQETSQCDKIYQELKNISGHLYAFAYIGPRPITEDLAEKRELLIEQFDEKLIELSELLKPNFSPEKESHNPTIEPDSNEHPEWSSRMDM